MDGIRIRGSLRMRDGFRSVGRVRCIGAEISGNVECDGGRFHNPRGEDALWANTITVGGNLFLRHGCRVDGQIRLIGARVGRSVDLYGGVFTRPEGFALAARGCTVGGDFQAARADISGSVHLHGATIAGQVDFSGSRIRRTRGLAALTLTGAVVSGAVVLGRGRTYRGVQQPTLAADPVVIGRIEAENCRIGGHLFMEGLRLNGSVPSGPDATDARRVAVRARGATVGGAVTIAGDSVVQGVIDLSGTDLAGLRILAGCRLFSGGSDALDLSSAQIRSGLVVDQAVPVRGTLRLTSAHVRGNLTLRGTEWREPRARSAISAQALVVDGESELQRIRVHAGTVNLRGATLRGRLNLAKARLRCLDGPALDLHQAQVAGALDLDRARIVGSVGLSRAVVTGQASLAGVRLRRTGTGAAPALDLDGAQALGGADLRWKRVTGAVTADGFVTSVLADDPDRWPPGSVLTGMSYERFAATGPTGTSSAGRLAARLRWLERMPAYDPGPYEQLARVLRAHGLGADAERALIASRRRALVAERSALATDVWWRRARIVGRRALGELVGFGYRPAYALAGVGLLVLLLAAVMVNPGPQGLLRADDGNGTVYGVTGPRAPAPPAPPGPAAAPPPATPPATPSVGASAGRVPPCGDGAVPCFNPLYFAVDTVVPIVDLKQRSAWRPEADGLPGQTLLFVLNVATLLGWFLSSVFVLAFTKVVRTGS